MKKKRFKQLMKISRTMIWEGQNEFFLGFRRGLSRNYHGDNFGTKDDHEKMMTCKRGNYHRDMQAGYRAGYYHDKLKLEDLEDLRAIRLLLKVSASDLAKIAGVSRRTVEGWYQGRPVPESCKMLIRQYFLI